MNRATKLTLAAAVALAALATAVQSASASPPPIEPPNPDTAVVVPADFVTLTDDTGTITVAVPNTWTDIDTAPLFGEQPSIKATPDWEALLEGWNVPGVSYRAASFTADTETLAHDLGAIGDECATEALQPYDDGLFVGTHRIYTGCGELGTAEFHVVAANPANQAFTAVLKIQITSPAERPILDGILATFNMTAGTTPGVPSAPVTAPTTTVLPPTTTTATAAAFPPPTGDVPADWAMLVDDTGTLAIRVPSTWTTIDLAPKTNRDGSPQPWISATTDHGLFFPPEGTADTFSVPGVIFHTYPIEPVTTERLAASVYNDVCTADPAQTYDDGAYAGYIQSFNGCGGTDSRIVELVANPPVGSVTVSLLVQLTGQPDDAATLDGLLSSFLDLTAFVPAPTTTVPAPTTAAAGSDPFDTLEQLLYDQLGVTISDEQASCLADGSGLDPNDIVTAVDQPYVLDVLQIVLLDCGVDLFDVPSGGGGNGGVGGGDTL